MGGLNLVERQKKMSREQSLLRSLRKESRLNAIMAVRGLTGRHRAGLLVIIASTLCISLLRCVCKASVLFGFTTADSVTLTSTTTLPPSSSLHLTKSFSHIHHLSSDILLGLTGDPAQCDMFLTLLNTQIKRIHHINRSYASPSTIAHLARYIIATNIRKVQLNIKVLIGGVDRGGDSSKEIVLYYLDEIGSLRKVPYAVHGAEMPFILSLLDRINENVKKINGKGLLGVAGRGEDVVQECWKVLKERSVLSVDDKTIQIESVCRP